MFRLQVTIIRQTFQYMDMIRSVLTVNSERAMSMCWNILLCCDWTIILIMLQHNRMVPIKKIK